MSASKHLIALAISTALAIGQSAVAQEPAGDSAYQWGRWAVLSPAAGGEPFSAPDAPGAAYNVRPGDLYGPEVLSTQAPPVGPPTVGPPTVGDVDPTVPIITQPPTVRTPPSPIVQPPTVRVPPGA